MIKLIKWLIDKVGKSGSIELLWWICEKVLPIEDWIDTICDILYKLAQKTETLIDDEFVDGLRQTLKDLLVKK